MEGRPPLFLGGAELQMRSHDLSGGNESRRSVVEKERGCPGLVYFVLQNSEVGSRSWRRGGLRLSRLPYLTSNDIGTH